MPVLYATFSNTKCFIIRREIIKFNLWKNIGISELVHQHIEDNFMSFLKHRDKIGLIQCRFSPCNPVMILTIILPCVCEWIIDEWIEMGDDGRGCVIVNVIDASQKQFVLCTIHCWQATPYYTETYTRGQALHWYKLSYCWENGWSNTRVSDVTSLYNG